MNARKAHDSNERLITSGGSIYSIATGVVKEGVQTRGRGYWAGKLRIDQDNPDVDSPSEGGAETLIEDDELDEGMEDDVSPTDVWARVKVGKNAVDADLKQARAMVEAASGGTIGKSTLTLRSVNVDLLLQSPEDLSEDALVKSADTVTRMMANASSDGERDVLSEYAGRVARALRTLMEAREESAAEMAKAILTKKSKESSKEPEHKAKKTSKSSERKVNGKGKVDYKYDKKNGGKGPAERAKQAGPPGAPGADAPPGEGGEVTPPPKVDPEPFCAALGITEAQLEKFCSKKSRRDFVDYFMGQEALVEKRKLTPAWLGRLYDSVTQPEEPQAQPQSPAGGPQKPAMAKPGAGPAPAMPGMKSIVVFNGATLNARTLAVIDMLKSHKAETVGDIRKCLQTHYACTEPESVRATMTLLNRWEREGLVSFYPAKG